MSEFDPRPVDSNETSEHRLPAVPAANIGEPIGQPLPAAPWIDGEEKQHGGFNFMSFLHSLRRRWLLGVGLGCLLASTLALLIWFFVPINSEALVQIRVRRAGQQMLRDKYTSPEHPLTFEIKKKTQMDLLGSTFVVSAALRKARVSQLPLVRYKAWLGKRENPIAWLESQLKVASDEKSEVFNLSMKAPFSQRDQLVTLLNAIKEAYMRECVDAEKATKSNKLSTLRKRQGELSRTVRDQMERIADLSKTYGSTQSEAVQVQLELHYRTLASLQREKGVVDQAYFDAYDSLLLQQQMIASNQSYKPHEFEIEDVLLQYPEYATMKSQLIELQSATQAQGARARGPMGASAAMQTQMGQLMQQMEQFKYEKQDEAVQRLRLHSNRDDRILQQEAEMLQARLANLAKRREMIYGQHQELQDNVRQMGAFSSDLQVRQLDLESNQETLNRIGEEIQTLQLEMELRPQIEVVHDAIIPDTEGNWIMKYMQIIATWMLTFMGTVLGIALWDMQHQRVNNSQEVIETGDIRVIGSLPALNGRRAGGLLPVSGNHRRMIEMTLTRSIDSIRTALVFARHEQPYQVIMVTSALGQEGKTTVASQLAVSFARSGRRTLLIDGDIRNPQQHVVLGMPMDRGLAELLRSECTLDDVLKATPAEGLWCLSAGYRDAYTDQNMNSVTMEKLFTELRNRFDSIIIDTGPTLTSPDAMVLGQHANATIISVRRDISRLPKVNEAIEQLRSVGVHIAGTVLNGAGVDIRESETKLVAGAETNDPQLEKV